MNGSREINYKADFCVGGKSRRKNKAGGPQHDGEPSGCSIPRIARLMALAIRFEGLLREEKIHDYAELARLGSVTRARMTQIMKLLDLAADIQEQILFLHPVKGLNERNLRPLVSRIGWTEQRCLFQEIVARSGTHAFHRQPTRAGAIPHGN